MEFKGFDTARELVDFCNENGIGVHDCKIIFNPNSERWILYY